jgi:hypothetical protein
VSHWNNDRRVLCTPDLASAPWDSCQSATGKGFPCSKNSRSFTVEYEVCPSASSNHADGDAVLLEQLDEVITGELTAPIGVEYAHELMLREEVPNLQDALSLLDEGDHRSSFKKIPIPLHHEAL